jgi:hypothetical protein
VFFVASCGSHHTALTAHGKLRSSQQLDDKIDTRKCDDDPGHDCSGCRQEGTGVTKTLEQMRRISTRNNVSSHRTHDLEEPQGPQERKSKSLLVSAHELGCILGQPFASGSSAKPWLTILQLECMSWRICPVTTRAFNSCQ